MFRPHLRLLTILDVVVVLASDHKLLTAPVKLFLAFWLQFDAWGWRPSQWMDASCMIPALFSFHVT